MIRNDYISVMNELSASEGVFTSGQAARLGITPNAGEITGGPFLSKRFGGWKNVVAAAGLPQPRRQKPIASRQIFREEFKRQMELYAQELQAGEHPGENSKP